MVDYDVEHRRLGQIISQLACPICRGTVNSTILAMITHRPDGHIVVQGRCVLCHIYLMVDPNASDTTAAHNSGPISGDDLIDVSLILKNFEGPLIELFNQPRPRT